MSQKENTLPEPLVPAHVDLRDFPYMPLHGGVLLDSDTWMLSTADEKVAALTLWWKSWQQQPAGSLPADDRFLSKLAGYGIAVKSWLLVKENALRGWTVCSDGRLYHGFVAACVAEAWLLRMRAAWFRENDRLRKENKKRTETYQQPLEIPDRPTINSIGFPSDVVARAMRFNVEHQRKGVSDPPETTKPSAGIPPEISRVKGREDSNTPLSPPSEGGRASRRKNREGEAELNTPEERERNQQRARYRGWKKSGMWLPAWGRNPDEDPERWAEFAEEVA